MFSFIYNLVIFQLFKFVRCAKTDNGLTELINQYSLRPTQKIVYETDGKKYTVIRHFVGSKDVNQVVKEIAVSRANRETGLE